MAGYRSSGNGVFRTLRAVTSGILVLAFVFFANQLTGEGTNYSSHAVGNPSIELTDQHPENQSHDPGSGHHGESCSVAACVSIVLARRGSEYRDVASPDSNGVSPDSSIPLGIILARDPPIPRLAVS